MQETPAPSALRLYDDNEMSTPGNTLRRTAAAVRSREPRMLVIALILVLCALVFVVVADEVAEGDTARIDERVVRAFRDPDRPGEMIGPDWSERFVRELSALGSFPVLTLVTLAAAGFVALSGRGRTVAVLMISACGAMALAFTVKALLDRPRPDLPVPEHSSASFPSAHAMGSAAVYLTLGVMLAAVLEQRRTKAYVLALALSLAGIIGVTRVMLGVHYPTDVLGGWAGGLAWALGCWVVARLVDRRTDAHVVG